jgi:hypothetical protein
MRNNGQKGGSNKKATVEIEKLIQSEIRCGKQEMKYPFLLKGLNLYSNN